VCVCFRYNVMLQCWHDSPGLRPSFSDLVSDLDRILGLCVSDVRILIIQTVHAINRTTETVAFYEYMSTS